MNRHFKDSQYYLRRAVSTAKHGVIEELEPVRARATRFRGEDEQEEEVGRVGRVRTRAKAGARRARGEIERAISRGRERVESVRRRAAR